MTEVGRDNSSVSITRFRHWAGSPAWNCDDWPQAPKVRCSDFYQVPGGSRKKKKNEQEEWDFPGGPVVKTSPSNAEGAGSIPDQGAKIPHASWPKNQNIKQKQYCNKFHKDFKKWSTSKKKKKKNNKQEVAYLSF